MLKRIVLVSKVYERTTGYVHTFIPEKVNFVYACTTRLHSLVGHAKINCLD